MKVCMHYRIGAEPCSTCKYDALAAHAKALEETLRSAHSELTDHGHQELGECECRIAYVLGSAPETGGDANG
jgi:hypothetical protein